MVTVAPLIEIGMAERSGTVEAEETAYPLESWIAGDVSVVEGEMVKANVATTPSDIVLELMPHRTQVEVPGVSLQPIDAVVRLEVTLNEAISLVE